MLAFAGNSGANLALQNGDVDWSDQFIPNIQKTFIDKDPAHRHFWYPTTGGTINWQLNTTKAPFNDPVVRKALSMAVDRDQVDSLGMSGYTHPADCTGLSDTYASWRDQGIVENCDWTKLNVDKANQMLDDAGYKKGTDGIRTLKDGKPFQFKFSVGSASSDWLSVGQIISKNMEKLGVKVEVNSPDWSQVVSGYTDGSFDSGIVWSNSAATPFEFYRGVMSQKVVVPVGQRPTKTTTASATRKRPRPWTSWRQRQSRQRRRPSSTPWRHASMTWPRWSRCFPVRRGAPTPISDSRAGRATITRMRLFRHAPPPQCWF